VHSADFRGGPVGPIAAIVGEGMLCAFSRAMLAVPLTHYCRRGRLPTELFAHARPDLLGAITRGDFDILDAGLAQSFLLDRIPGGRRTLIVPAALIFDSGDRPSTRSTMRMSTRLPLIERNALSFGDSRTSPRLVCAKTR